MNHPAELALHQYLEDAVNGKTQMSAETIEQVANDIKEALHRQFGKESKRREFTLRMSNIGRPSCQLWFEKNHPDKALPKPTTFVMNMMIGDIVEAVFKGLLTEAGVKYENSDKVSLELHDTSISGTYDIVIDGAVDDIKSASDWSYRNKFDSFETLKNGDSFGYVGQLAGYAKASGKEAGGWWVVNKSNGEFKYVPATGIDIDAELDKAKFAKIALEKDEVQRCFEPVEEVFRGKPTGNKILGVECGFCSYKHACWPNLKEMPSVMSKAKDPKIVSYVELVNDGNPQS